MNSEQRRLEAEQQWAASPEFKTDIERIADRQDRIGKALKAKAKTKETYRDEHDYYWIGAFCKKCTHCGVIKDVLFDTPKWRNVKGKDRDYEPNCVQKS